MIDELVRLNHFRADVPPPDEAARLAAQRALRETIGREVEGRRRRPARVIKRGARRWLLPALSAAAVAIVAAVLANVFRSGSPAPSAASAAMFQRLAAVAAAQPSPTPGQYLYVESVQSNESIAPEVGCTMYVPEKRQIWIGADGSGRLLETTAHASFPSPRDRAACARAGLVADAAPGTGDTWFAPRCLSLGPVNLAHLPSDPVALRRLLDARKIEGGPPGPAEDFVQIGDLLRETDASPGLRATIYKVAATIPGVRLLGATRDHARRLGIGLSYGDPSDGSTLILDPKTSALMGELTRDGAGRVVGWSVYRRSMIVDSIPGRPPAPLRPACAGGGGRSWVAPDGVRVMNGDFNRPPAGLRSDK